MVLVKIKTEVIKQSSGSYRFIRCIESENPTQRFKAVNSDSDYILLILMFCKPHTNFNNVLMRLNLIEIAHKTTYLPDKIFLKVSF